MKNTEKAFHWIIDILENNEIKYKISGGFAARIYGVNRELADIDIEVADNDIKNISKYVDNYIKFGPAHYKDNNWDLELMTLTYEEQEIDIAGTGAKIFNKQSSRWEQSSGDLNDIQMKKVFGKIIPVESLKTLISYKSKLSRDVDIEDVKQLLYLNKK